MGDRGVTPEECRFLKIKKRGNIDIYNVYFNSVSEIQLFLKSYPPVNNSVFTNMKSVTATAEFAGPDLEKAISYCVGGYQEKYDQFLELAHQLEAVNKKNVGGRSVETSFVGQRPNVPAYVAGAPKNMYRVKKTGAKNVINVFMNVTYDNSTTENQIQHRGIISLNLINILEQNDYIVNFRLFEICKVYNEVFLCEVMLKKPGEKLNPRVCYYPMCGKSFVRRVLSRIKESMPFKENWGLSYGSVLPEKYAKLLIDIKDNDIYIGSPAEMGIRGDNIYEDADAFIEKLGIEGKIIIPKYKGVQ